MRMRAGRSAKGSAPIGSQAGARDAGRLGAHSHQAVSRLSEVDGDKPTKEAFDTCPIGCFHIDIAKVETAEAKPCLFVAIDRTSRFVLVRMVERATRVTAFAVVEALVAAMP